jgi:hypothetical protein
MSLTTRRLLPTTLCAIAACCAAACTTPLGRMTVISTQKVYTPPEPLQRSVEGIDCAHFAFGGVPVSGRITSNVERALRRALRQVPEGNTLTDVRIYNEVLLAYVYSRFCVRVRGNVAVLR